MSKVMDQAISEANQQLINTPFAATVVLGKKDGVHGYHWQDNSKEAQTARTKIRKVLWAAWQSSASNYQYIADRMRIDALSVQGLIDEQFRGKTGL